MGAAFLAVDFRKDEETFTKGLADLPAYARAIQRAGVRRTGTWIPPGSDSLTYRQHFTQTARRLREVARLLGDHDVRLGLEYVAPRTAWVSRRYPFLHTMAETRELVGDRRRRVPEGSRSTTRCGRCRARTRWPRPPGR